MINRNLQKVKVISYSGESDDYGQVKISPLSQKFIEMSIVDYTKNNTNDMTFIEVEKIGLTKDSTINDAQRIEIDGVLYDVLQVMHGRLYEVLLKKH